MSPANTESQETRRYRRMVGKNTRILKRREVSLFETRYILPGKKKPLFLQWLNRNMAWQKPPDCRVIWQLKSVSRKKKSDWQKETPCQQEQHINKLPGSAQALPLTRICVIQLTPSAWAQSYSAPSLQIPRSFVFTVPSLKSLLDSLSVTSSPLPSENIAKFWETRFLYLKYNCFRHRRATAKECSSQARGLS